MSAERSRFDRCASATEKSRADWSSDSGRRDGAAGLQTVGRPTRGIDRDPRPRHRDRRDVRPGRPAAGRQQALRRPQHQDPFPAAGPGRLHRPADTATTAPRPGPRTRRSTTTGAWAATITAMRAAGSRQQAGPRRLPRHRRMGSHHRPARRSGPDPRRDHQAARCRPHRRPGHPAQAARAGPGQGRHRDHRDNRGLLRAADHHR